MGGLKLQLCSPQRIEGIASDPEPDWSFEGLLSELNSLEKKLSAASTTPVYFPKSHAQRFGDRKGSVLMRIDDGLGALGSDSDTEEEDEEEERGDLCLGPAWRFSCNELYLSDSDASDLESVAQDQPCLLDEADLVEDAIFELTEDNQQLIKEEARQEISLLETKLLQEGQKWAQSSARIEKYVIARREADKKLDVHYQRKIAEALDNHITALQRDHELKSQIEERKIHSDAAYEEAKKKEKAAQEERLRLERARAEAEEKARREEAAKLAALAAEKKAVEEAAEREAKEASERLSAAASRQEAFGHKGDTGSEDSNSRPQGSGLLGNKDSRAVNVVRATERALSIEQERLQKLKKLEEDNDSLMLNSKMDFSSHQRHITRLIKQTSGVQQNVIGKANEIIKILKNTSCPQSITIATFAKKVVANCESPNNVPFGSAHVIVLVASQVPEVLDFVLAELHRACIYTIPKHIVYSESHFGSRGAYYKALGYREDDGKMENVQSYLNRLKSYMMLYGALVQTEETQGVHNSHGPKEGWAWLARFLNKLPANRYTAVALNTFLQAAGFVLFKKYNKNVNKPQFMKILNVIKDDFLKALIERKDSELNPIISEIQSYIEDKKFLKEPEGRKLQGPLLSNVWRPESEPRMQPRTQYYY